MPAKVLDNKAKAFIRKNRLKMSSRDMAARIGCSRSPISRYLKSENLTPPKKVIELFRLTGMRSITTSDERTDRILKKYYLKLPEKRLAQKVKRSDTFVRTRLRQLGLLIPRDIIEKRIRDSRIKPGAIPFNKGRKQKEYMTRSKIRATMATRFKCGHLPHNTKKDLEITVRTDKRGVDYKFIRISLGNWLPLHRFIWEKKNGPIPKKMKLVFKDGDPMNCELSNLELVSPAELMLRNSLHNYPEPIVKTIQLRGALNRQINKHLKRLKDEK